MARSRWRNDDGAAAVEFAFVLPLLLLLLLGIVEFGAAYNAQIMLTNAAREAARSMSVQGDEAEAEAAALAALAPIGLASDATEVTFTVSPAGACTGTAQLTAEITVQRPLLTGLFGATLPMSATATRQCGG